MALSEGAVTLGPILLMDEQNKWRQSTDAHRHSSQLCGLGGEMLRVVPGEGAWRGHSHCSG